MSSRRPQDFVRTILVPEAGRAKSRGFKLSAQLRDSLYSMGRVGTSQRASLSRFRLSQGALSVTQHASATGAVSITNVVVYVRFWFPCWVLIDGGAITTVPTPLGLGRHSI